ncbi:MAG: FHIPEP family type III secretion protein [Cyanobacteria bacterium P01_F01_bin.53]
MSARTKVFLSHSSINADLAHRLALDLQAANIDVWLDQWELGVGEEIVQNIEQGVDEADFVIVLLTRASVASDWVNREWRRKVYSEAKTERVEIVPVRSEFCEMPDFLAQRSYADISGGSYPLGFRHLLEILCYYSDAPSIERPEGRSSENRSSEGRGSENRSLEGGPFAATTSQILLPIVAPIALEVGRDLIPFFEPDSNGANRFFDELSPAMRDALHTEFGFPFPGIRVRGNETDMPPDAVLISIDEIPESIFTVAQAGDQQEDGDAAEFICLALQAVLRRMATSFLDIDVTQRLVDTVTVTLSKLVADIVPTHLSWIELTEIFQRLVEESISIGEVERILQALCQCDPNLHDTVLLAEQARHALRGQITAKFRQGNSPLAVLRLAPEIENNIASAIQHTPMGQYLALEPQFTEQALAAIRSQVKALKVEISGVQILTTTEIRRYVRKLVELEFPSLQVLSHQDLEPDTVLHVIAQIHLEGPSQPSSPHLISPNNGEHSS